MPEEKGILTLRIENLESILDVLNEVNSGSDYQYPDKIVFAKEVEDIFIRVVGEKYHSSVTGSFARGIWGYQEEIYRAVAFSLYRTEDLRKLTKEDYERFNLVFQVEEGSSALLAPIGTFMSELGEGLSDMSDEYKLIAILGVATILVTGWAVMKIGNSFLEAKIKKHEVDGKIKEEEIRSKAEVERMAETTRQIQALTKSNPIVERFGQATENGVKQIFKGIPDAESATVGMAYFDRSAIKDVNAREAREVSDLISLRQEFVVVGYKRPQGSDVARFTLTSPSGEFSAVMDLADNGPFSAEQKTKFWHAAEKQSPISLGVEAKVLGGVVQQAWVSDIP